MGGIAWDALLLNLVVTAGVTVLLMAGVLGWAVRTGTVTVVDTVWGAGLALVSVIGYLLSSGDGDDALRLLVTVLTTAWGVRLGWHIWLRGRGKGDDPRYLDLYARHPGNRTVTIVVWVCVPQGAALWFVSLPVQFAQYVTLTPAWWLLALGTLVWSIGFVFESVGDAQLARFRADEANRGTVLDTGLWRYTRHPNYFGDACVWWGIYLCACVTWPGAATILSPLAMTLALARGTGKPMMEAHLSARPGYPEYVRRTSGFIPLPPRPSP